MRKYLFLLFFHFFYFSIAFGQDSSFFSTDELYQHISFLTSEIAEGRYPGTPGYDTSAGYCKERLSDAGISQIVIDENGSRSFFQQVSFNSVIWDKSSNILIKSKLNDYRFNLNDHFVFLSGKPFNIKEHEAKLVYLSAGIHEPEFGIDCYKDVDVKGKWVIITRKISDELKKKLPKPIFQKYTTFPYSDELREKFALEAGAAGVIYTRFDPFSYWKILTEVFAKHVFLAGTEKLPFHYNKLPGLLIDSVAAETLFRGQTFNPFEYPDSVISFELTETSLKLEKVYSENSFKSFNVVGYIEGTDSVLRNEFITVGAHLDHDGKINGVIMNGADDNASGCAAVLSLAKKVAKQRPRRSVIFVLYTAEELGLLGSYYFTENLPISKEKVLVNLNLDMIGRSDGNVENGISVNGSDRIDPGLTEKIKDVYYDYKDTEIDWDYGEKIRNSFSDDYCYFIKNIPSAEFFGGFHKDYHSYTDDIEKIDFKYLQNNCMFFYHLIMDLANSEIIW